MKRKNFWEVPIQIVLVIMGLITTLPVLALIDPATALRTGYGITNIDPMTQALLQHRGMFQLVLGLALCGVAFFRSTRIPVSFAAITTKSTFLLLILPNRDIQPDLPLATVIFDTSCIVILSVVIIYEVWILYTLRNQKMETTSIIS